MRVAGRVAAGSVVLLVLLVAVLAYHVAQVQRLVRVNRQLAAVTFRTATVALELTRRIDQIDEYTRKLFVTGDPAYAERVDEAMVVVRAKLQELMLLDLSADESLEVGQLRRQWQAFPFAGADTAAMVAASRAPDAGERLKAVTDATDLLRLQARTVFTAAERAVGEQVVRSTEAAEAVSRVSLVVIALALLASVVTVVLTVRSISAPLRRLTEGTRAVAAGSFSTQLEADGGDEFAEVAGDFNAMVRRLGELDQLKKDFVSHVSHELKTPLVAMQETTRLLLDEEVGPLTERQRRLLGLNLQGGTRLAAMISALLDISRMESGSLVYDHRPHDLGPLLERAAAELEALAAEHGVTLEVEKPEPALLVWCDADRVVQVVQNLLHNAIRFSPRGERVRLLGQRLAELPAGQRRGLPESVAGRDGSRFAAISVADRGPGVPAADRTRIFEKFRQLGTRAESRGGVGLGLAICQQIVDDHGGAIWVADAQGSGSVFTFLLPLTVGRERSQRVESRPEGTP
ncbi:MAG: ATP-binding protein [Acidobacteriota bacterium]